MNKINILGFVLLVLAAMVCIWALVFNNLHYIEGIYLDGEYKDPDLHGGYDWTVISLQNYTVTGPIKARDDEFVFDNIFEGIDDLTVGYHYRFYYHVFYEIGSDKPYYILDDVEKIGKEVEK